jgi:hypothetical protein
MQHIWVQLYDYYGVVSLKYIIKFEGMPIVLYNTRWNINHVVKQILCIQLFNCRQASTVLFHFINKKNVSTQNTQPDILRV